MKGLGGFLVLLSIASAILPLIGRQLVIFTWIDNWGSTVAWVIRGIIMLLGLILLFLVGKKAGGDSENEA